LNSQPLPTRHKIWFPELLAGRKRSYFCYTPCQALKMA